MTDTVPEVIVAGHVCLDIIPAIRTSLGEGGGLLRAGSTSIVGPAVVSTGGAVSNTGIALHRLGIRTRLMGKVGDDVLGRATLEVLRACDPALAEGMIVSPGEHSSYTVVINPPQADRAFLHFPGPNDTFAESDVADGQLAGARLFHFGYPPLMRRLSIDGGHELARLFRRVRARGLATGLDMTMPDPQSESGRVAWTELLRTVLPHVDLFMPSVGEIMFMLERQRFDELRRNPAGFDATSPDGVALLDSLAARLLEMGTAVVLLKLGDQGVYLKTAAEMPRLLAPGATARAAWANRHLLAPCFEVQVAGTTGAGDCAVAGFLSAVLRGAGPERSLIVAAGAGACCVERPDATSGVPSWADLERRIDTGWRRRARPGLPGWRMEPTHEVWIGPQDATAR